MLGPCRTCLIRLQPVHEGPWIGCTRVSVYALWPLATSSPLTQDYYITAALYLERSGTGSACRPPVTAICCAVHCRDVPAKRMVPQHLGRLDIARSHAQNRSVRWIGYERRSRCCRAGSSARFCGSRIVTQATGSAHKSASARYRHAR